MNHAFSLTPEECHNMTRIMNYVLEEIEIEKRSFRVADPKDVQYRRIVRAGDDITDDLNSLEKIAKRWKKIFSKY